MAASVTRDPATHPGSPVGTAAAAAAAGAEPAASAAHNPPVALVTATEGELAMAASGGYASAAGTPAPDGAMWTVDARISNILD